MAEKTIQLKGPAAILVLLVFGGVVAFQYVARDRTLKTEAVEEVKTAVVAAYMREHLPQLKAMFKAPEANRESIAEIAGQISRDRIEIVSIDARGSGEDIVVQVEIEVDGKPPLDGKPVRYFRMSHSMMTGWLCQQEVSKWSYYLTF